MAPGDIAFKSNFATLDPGSGVVLRRRADRRFEDLGPVLCAALDGLRLPSFPQVSKVVLGVVQPRRWGPAKRQAVQQNSRGACLQ
jgi:hypothetical protein